MGCLPMMLPTGTGKDFGSRGRSISLNGTPQSATRMDLLRTWS